MAVTEQEQNYVPPFSINANAAFDLTLCRQAINLNRFIFPVCGTHQGNQQTTHGNPGRFD